MPISRRSLAAAFACTPALATPALAAPAPLAALSAELKSMLIQAPLLQAQYDVACDRLAAADGARKAAEAANPWPAITERDEQVFNHTVKVGHPAGWTFDRFDWVQRQDHFAKAARACEAERIRHEARLQRIEELRPEVERIEKLLLPLFEEESDAQAVVDQIDDAEQDMLRALSAINARSVRELIAKACVLGLVLGETLEDPENSPVDALAYSIARDLLAMGEANV